MYDYYRERTSQQHHHQFFNPNIIGQFKNMPIEKLIPACQLFYEKKLIEGNGLGQLEWRKGPLDADLLLKYIEIICKSTFEQRYLTLFGTEHSSLSNHFMSLIFGSKKFKDRFKFSQNCISSRINYINKLSEKAEDLSTDYDDTKLDEFLSQEENLILVEYFLESQK